MPDQKETRKTSASPRRKTSGKPGNACCVYRRIFEDTPEGIMIFDANTGDIVDVNTSLAAILRCTREEFLEHKILDMFSLEDMSAYHSAVAELKQKKVLRHRNFPLRAKDGRQINVAFSCRLLTVRDRQYVECAIREMLPRQASDPNESRYRNILETIEDGYYEVDLKGRLTFFNDALCRINGYPREELMNTSYKLYAGTSSAQGLFEAFHRVYKTGKTGKGVDYEIIAKDGSKRFVDTSIALLRDREGRITGFHGIVRDITERKAAENALRASEEKYRQAFSSTSDIILMLDNDLHVSSITPSVEKIIGYSSEDFIGHRIDELSFIMSPASLELATENVARVLSGDFVSNTIYEFLARDGHIVLGEVTASPIRQEGATLGLIAIARDITKRKNAEDALKQNEYFLRKSQEVAHLGSYDFNIRADHWISSPILDDIFGIDAAYPKNTQGWLEITHPDDREGMRTYLMENVIREKNVFEKEYRIVRHKDGQTRWVYGIGELAFDEKGKTVRMIGTIQDITERKRMKEEIARSELKYRSIVESAQEGIFQILPDDGRLSLNPALAAMLGYASPEEAEKAIASIPKQVYVYPDDYWKVMDIIKRDGGVKGFEAEFYRKDKSRIWVNMSVSAVRDETDGLLYYHGIVEDITPKKIMEQERQDSIERLRKSLGATIRAMAATV
ncbi:MAG: PAS domain S-box protein, partial [Smithellaceae bacterium]